MVVSGHGVRVETTHHEEPKWLCRATTGNVRDRRRERRRHWHTVAIHADAEGVAGIRPGVRANWRPTREHGSTASIHIQQPTGGEHERHFVDVVKALIHDGVAAADYGLFIDLPRGRDARSKLVPVRNPHLIRK